MLLEAGEVPDASDLTVSAFVRDMWLPHLEGRVRSGSLRRRTLEGYASKMDNHVLPYLGAIRLDRLDTYAVDRWLAAMTAAGVSAHTRRHAFRIAHNAVRAATRWRLRRDNPLDGVQCPTVPERAVVALSAAQANAVLDAFAGHEMEPIVVLCLAAGLRRSEVCALDWSDVDLSTGTVTVRRGRHERAGEVWDEPPKTERSKREVSLPAWALEALSRHAAVGPVTSLSPERVSYRYRKHLAASGLPDVPLMNLRHTHATLALAAGVDVVVVSRRLGHSTVATTDRFYLAPGRDADRDAADRLDGLRPNATQGETGPISTHQHDDGRVTIRVNDELWQGRFRRYSVDLRSRVDRDRS